MSISHSRLLESLKYDPETGEFSKRVGAEHKRTGYRYVMVDNVTYPEHRLAWFYMTGEWPSHDIDHINGQKSDNRFSNLRDVPETLNAQNERRVRGNNKSGYMGVFFRKERGKWEAKIRINGKTKRLGSFTNPEDAHVAYLEAKRKHHPGFML